MANSGDGIITWIDEQVPVRINEWLTGPKSMAPDRFVSFILVGRDEGVLMNTSKQEQEENLCRRGPLIDDWPSADVYPPKEDEPDEMCASQWKLPCCGRFLLGRARQIHLASFVIFIDWPAE